MLSNLFPTHPYGTQTTIGTVEHLKNPSLVKIRNFYNTYYVPNNMAIILSGDFNPDEMIAAIDEKFSYMQAKPIPVFNSPIEKPRTEPKVIDVFGPDAENIMIGYRLPGANTREELLLTMCDMILANSKAGLIDLNLIKKQAVLAASSSPWVNHDYSILFLTGKPKKGQSLDEVRNLLLDQINIIKKGEFDEGILKAIISNLKIGKIEEQKSNQGRAYAMLDAFTLNKNWANAVSMISEMNKITKAEIMEFANKYFTNDYVVVNKKSGEDKSIVKVPKPNITPVDVNRDDVSPFVTKIKETPSEGLKPVFLDYNKDITFSNFEGKAPIYYVQNKDNELFQLYYVLDMGKFNDLKLPIAFNLLQFLGTDKLSSEEISKEFFKLACNFNVSASNEQVYVTLNGLNENFEASVKLFENLLANAKPDEVALKNYIERVLKGRADAKLNKNAIRSALSAYAIYGAKNPNTYNLSESELKALNAADLVNNYIKKINQYKHTIYYFGPLTLDNFKNKLKSYHVIPKKQLSYPPAVSFTRNETKENIVYFTDYKMVQAEVSWINKSDKTFDSTSTSKLQLFNEYFGGGMSSLVFQTIRESKALAYSTYSYYQTPSKKTDPYYTLAYVGTQADKINEAIPAMNELLTTLPKNEANIENAKASIKNSIETERINDENIIFSYVSSQKLGIHHDLRRDVYNEIDKLTFDDLNNFYKSNYTNKPYFYTIVASKDKVNLNDLSKYGKVIEVSISEIFGY
jgi:predicted Zn-dependent peptidase